MIINITFIENESMVFHMCMNNNVNSFSIILYIVFIFYHACFFKSVILFNAIIPCKKCVVFEKKINHFQNLTL